MSQHNVVHTTLLKPFWSRDKPQDLDKDQEEIWTVEKIVNSRIVIGIVQYLVWWTGYTKLADLWQMFDHLDNCPEHPQEFWQNFPRKQ